MNPLIFSNGVSIFLLGFIRWIIIFCLQIWIILSLLFFPFIYVVAWANTYRNVCYHDILGFTLFIIKWLFFFSFYLLSCCFGTQEGLLLLFTVMKFQVYFCFFFLLVILKIYIFLILLFNFLNLDSIINIYLLTYHVG